MGNTHAALGAALAVVLADRFGADLQIAPATLGGYGFHASYVPAARVGRDCYGFVDLPDGRLVVAVGDVSGKGMQAALLMCGAVERRALGGTLGRGSGRRALVAARAIRQVSFRARGRRCEGARATCARSSSASRLAVIR